jgi:hypothetical protein
VAKGNRTRKFVRPQLMEYTKEHFHTCIVKAVRVNWMRHNQPIKTQHRGIIMGSAHQRSAAHQRSVAHLVYLLNIY